MTHTRRLAAFATSALLAGVVAGCEPGAGQISDASPTVVAPSSATATATVPTASPEPTADNPAAVLLELTSAPLAAEILPPGYTYVDSVETGHATSNVYESPEGAEGPMLFVYTDIDADYTSQRGSALDWQPLAGLAEPFTVTIARDSDDWTLIDIDASADIAVQFIGHKIPEADVIASAQRLLARAADTDG